ncbi:MAG: hypothetical protein LQ345_005816 [Seirophora villosa]|nr:MAG: hypothetical protein LQ345_005816 [Seirophora villosa]
MPPIRPISPFLDEATTSYVWSADDQDLHVDGQVLRLSIGVAVSDGNGNSDSRDDHAQSSVTNSQRHASLTETEPDHASLSPASEPGGTSPSSPRDAESERMAAPPRPDGQTTPSPGSTTDASSELHEPTGGSPPVAWAPRHVSIQRTYLQQLNRLHYMVERREAELERLGQDDGQGGPGFQDSQAAGDMRNSRQDSKAIEDMRNSRQDSHIGGTYSHNQIDRTLVGPSNDQLFLPIPYGRTRKRSCESDDEDSSGNEADSHPQKRARKDCV